MMKAFKRLVLGGAVAAAVAIPLLAPSQADAWWGPRWGWHGGVIVAPRVVVGFPAPYAYPPVHWIPAHYTYWGAFVPGHWGY